MNPQQTFYFIRRNTTDAAQGRDTMIRGTLLNQGQFKVEFKISKIFAWYNHYLYNNGEFLI